MKKLSTIIILLLTLTIMACAGVPQEGGKAPLDGTWTVTTTSGPDWFSVIDMLGDKKVIKGDSGYNLAKGIRWGDFTITKNEEVYTLTYEALPVVDRIWFTGPDKLVGVLYMYGDLIGSFKMERVK